MTAKKKPTRKKTASRKRKAPVRKKVTRKKVARKAAARKKVTRKKVSKKQATRKKSAQKKVPKKTSKKKVVKRKVVKKKVSKKKPLRKKVARKKPSQSKTSKKRISKKTVTTKIKGKPATTKTKNKATTKAAAPKTARKRNRSRASADMNPLEPSSSNTLIHGILPYRPRKTERYMSDKQLVHFRLVLHAWKQELMREVDRTVHHMQDEASNFPDPNDRATQESEFGLELRTRDRERKLLKKIAQAIGRIDDGSYGYCEETGEEIGLQRLEARPVATLSVEAQERRELAERQFSDRDDQYR